MSSNSSILTEKDEKMTLMDREGAASSHNISTVDLEEDSKVEDFLSKQMVTSS
jgi:hypothetical protein